MTNSDRSEQCQYIGREQLGPKYHMLCTAKPVPGRSYCEQHLEQVYQRGTALRRRHKDIRRANTVWDIESELNTVVEELESEGLL
jgi:hypothetical protein